MERERERERESINVYTYSVREYACVLFMVCM